ncbi:probable LRR receptor-like serine/threonine-protein kinase At4g29180 isoform X3 [Brachypodium distachyon]|nr:probable LRR receptor-like serine/threonine-protein kinase At4g29180 isoform X3 [Brachypodium distachyon]|eukprot:XP_024310895.1 probable LRR receptor-like serine/threonine-protein kinase At4g29180 isoform X3 [Brachypodium distachyon]
MVRSFLLQYLNFFSHSTYWKLSLISCPVVLLSWHKLNSEALHGYARGRKYYHLSDMPSQWPGCWMVMLVLVVMALSFISIHGQPDNHGFISIDCGYTASKEYVDSRTGLTYASDDGFIEAGLVHIVDPANLQPDLAVRYYNLRYFPSGPRNCYTFRSLTPGGKYLVRAAFGYGDYDKLNRLPTFDLYFGVNYWTTVTIVSSSTAYLFEIIAVSPADFLQICLVNTGSGTPFISALDLRTLTANLYPEANVTQSLVLLSFFRDTVGFGPNRYHFGTNYQHIRIMSSSGLVGEIDASFGQILLLQHLDLSHNSLSGSIPDFLGQLPALKFLDLSGNNLSGSIPCNLLEKSQNGLLALRVDNPNLHGDCAPSLIGRKNKIKLVLKIVLPVVAALVLLFVAVHVFVILPRRKKRPDVAPSANLFENRRFSYKELKRITNNFNTVIGKGGFGFVYLGKLENETQVAVKMRSDTSSQGDTEFLAEAQHLARVHHKNLVSLIGYCKDKKHLSLVYEYMDGGNLQDRLGGQEPLSWMQRLKIAQDSACGLEYLHKSCSPPLIHRDVKTGNILLTRNLEAKLSDFGLTRAFSSEEAVTHTTTQPAGTLGYLDPEYYATSHLSEKSDVYSFGAVLLVLITGRPAIITISETVKTTVALWVEDRLSEGDIENVTDPRIRGDCDINSVWKVAELALQCTRHAARDRPTMTEVVEGIGESLMLETSSRSMRCSSVGTGGSGFADGDSVGVLETEVMGETSAR